MEQPLIFRKGNSRQLVCRQKKAIYDLKQAPRVWFDKLKSTLVKMGCTSTKSDNSKFTKFNNGETAYILIYVDDILITRSNQMEISYIKQRNEAFSVKDLGNLNYFLGIEVSRKSNSTMHLSQR